ncbi:MAG: hypothetical protein GKR98_15030 [Boseongicola sp.]|nr:MAG: hypothetical protein GKR98_15030 [Boseongicola sp.]
MSAIELRHKFARNFVGMEKQGRLAAVAVVASFILQISLAVLTGQYLMENTSSAVAIAGVFLLIIFIGTRMRALNNIIHECSHATFTKKRSDNVLIGKFCASLLLKSFEDFRKEHLSHHAHLGDYEHDLDLKGLQDLRLEDPLTPRVIFRHIFTPLMGKHLPYYLGTNLSLRDGLPFLLFRVLLIVAFIWFTLLNPMAGLFLILVPFAFVFPAINYWVDCIDHAGLTQATDDLDASRNVAVPPLVRWLFFPRNDCYHLVHHLFPQIPATHLPNSHTTLTGEHCYATRTNAAIALPSDKTVLEQGTIPAE